jgi:hypothetical protein
MGTFKVRYDIEAINAEEAMKIAKELLLEDDEIIDISCCGP